MLQPEKSLLEREIDLRTRAVDGVNLIRFAAYPAASFGRSFVALAFNSSFKSPVINLSNCLSFSIFPENLLALALRNKMARAQRCHKINSGMFHKSNKIKKKNNRKQKTEKKKIPPFNFICSDLKRKKKNVKSLQLVATDGAASANPSTPTAALRPVPFYFSFFYFYDHSRLENIFEKKKKINKDLKKKSNFIDI